MVHDLVADDYVSRLATDGVPVIAPVAQHAVYDTVTSVIQEVEARGGRINAVAYDSDTEIGSHTDVVRLIPEMEGLLAPVAALLGR